MRPCYWPTAEVCKLRVSSIHPVHRFLYLTLRFPSLVSLFRNCHSWDTLSLFFSSCQSVSILPASTFSFIRSSHLSLFPSFHVAYFTITEIRAAILYKTLLSPVSPYEQTELEEDAPLNSDPCVCKCVSSCFMTRFSMRYNSDTTCASDRQWLMHNSFVPNQSSDKSNTTFDDLLLCVVFPNKTGGKRVIGEEKG